MSRLRAPSPFFIALVLSAFVFVLAAWHSWSMYRDFQEARRADPSLLQTGDLLAQEREIMSLAARLAAATGDLRGEERHKEAFRLLDAEIRRAKEGVTESSVGFPSARMGSTHERLAAIEREAFDLVRAGKREEAARLLSGDEYAEQERLYGQGMQAVSSALRSRAETHLEDLREGLFLGLAALLFGLPILVVAWLRMRGALDLRLAESEKIAEAAQKGRGELERRVRERTAELLRSNGDLRSEMEERRRVEEQLRHSQKMEAVGRLAGGVAHEFNNLVTVMRGHCDLLLRRLPANDPLREGIEQIREASERTAALTHRLLLFSHRRVGEPTVLNLNAVVADMEPMLRGLMGEDIVWSSAMDPAPGHIRADRSQIENAVLQLVVNSRDAMPTGGRITLEVRTLQLRGPYSDRWASIRANPYVVISVSDTGVGMDAETQSHLFEPYFTTKGEGHAGLGLSTVHGAVKQAGGHISVHSEPGKGATAQIYLPQVSMEGSPLPTGVGERAGARGDETILLVEDESAVRELIRRFLAMDGYTVFPAKDGAEALALCESHPEPIPLLIADVVMPQMGGREVAERLTALRPGLKVLFISGHPEETIHRHGIDPTVPLLHKPFTPGALSWKVREILDGGKA